MSQIFGVPDFVTIQRREKEELHQELHELVTSPAPHVDRGSRESRSVKHDRRTQKRCIKCRKWKDRQGDSKGFGDHDTSSDGLQSICFTCKNAANNKAREKNVVARVRHHMGTRCLTQLGRYAPTGFTSDMEKYLGYKVRALVKHLSADLKEREGPDRKLRDALNEGYHVDHLRPLSLFKVIVGPKGGKSVDWGTFKECWAISNLSAIPAADNLAKGAKYNSDGDGGVGGEEDLF